MEDCKNEVCVNCTPVPKILETYFYNDALKTELYILKSSIFKYVEETWPDDKYPHKTDIAQKTAEIMGVSTLTVYSVLKEYRNTGCVESPPAPAVKPSSVEKVDDMDLGAIRRKVHQFYFANKMPTISKIL